LPNISSSNTYNNIVEVKIRERVEAARKLRAEEQFDAAIGVYQKALFLKPEGAELYKELGEIYV
jgi:hypothetical protein